MQKIPTLFQRDYEGNHLVCDRITPGAEWVVGGAGIATRKFDGTSCLLRDGKLYKRYELKQNSQPPPGFEPAQEKPDAITGDTPGWLPVSLGNEDRWHREAFVGLYGTDLEEYDGCTFELCGPKVQGNPEKFDRHVLLLHGADPLPDAPRDYKGLQGYFIDNDIEGIVWHHPDGSMVKIKGRDFGIKRQRRA